ncbi:hypothetical protein [Pseudovibrio sp. Ad37]|uniref:hypothetical protein n=1 Tax=Pseudovibrio sp. Ad37 TaxID=989422 RepID=UPI0007AE4E67|nr:hypothetical protein [Pseudovibrio sp. Ad37]KZL14840.1 hypothetical protein PsAD37_04718 [Pseudovibrio sp. Ad37]
MTKYIQRISYDFDLYNEGDLFVTYSDKPFTGILFCEENGVLIGEEAVLKGVREGFSIDYYPNGQIEGVQETSSGVSVGINALWDKDGKLIYAQKRWYGTIIEELRLEGGVLNYEKKARDDEVEHILKSPVSNMYPFRKESIYDLLAEAEEKIKNGTVFDDPRLYSEG